MTWLPASFSSKFLPLVEPFPTIPLGPGSKNLAQLPLLKELATNPVCTSVLTSDAQECCRSALWLLHNFLDESHEISQEIHSSTGSFWHGIMHRREPDAGNAKYWFHRVGNHPVLQQLREIAPTVGYQYSTPFDFIDFCERHRDTGTKEEHTAIAVQQLEWQLLFAHHLS